MASTISLARLTTTEASGAYASEPFLFANSRFTGAPPTVIFHRYSALYKTSIVLGILGMVVVSKADIPIMSGACFEADSTNSL